MEVLIKQVVVKTTKLTVHPHFTISQLKSLIEDKQKVPYENQNLLFAGQELDQLQTLSHYDIKNNSSLYMLLSHEDRQMNLIVNDCDGDTLSLSVTNSSTIWQVKELCQLYKGVPSEIQELSFEGTTLDDNQTLSCYNIENNSIISLKRKKINYWIQIFVTDLTGRTTKLVVQSDCTILQVKEKYQESEGISVENQDLIFDDTRLNDLLRLSDYGIKNNSQINILFLLKIWLQIFLKLMNGKMKKLLIQNDTTISEMKKLFERQEGTSLENQPFIHLGQLLMDHQTISDCNIPNNALIRVMNKPAISICVKQLTGKITKLTLPPDSKISMLKKCYQNVEGIPTDNQRLLHAGRELVSDSTLADNNIIQDSVIYILLLRNPEEIQVFVKSSTGKSNTLKLKPTATALQVKKQYEEVSGLPIQKQKLFFCDRQLKNNRTLHDQGISKDSIITVRLRSTKKLQICIKINKCAALPLEVLMTDTIGLVKAKVQELTNIPIHTQKLYLSGKILSNDMLIKNCGIKRDKNLLELVLTRMEALKINYHCDDSKSFEIEFDLFHTVEGLKSQIHKLKGIPKVHQQLTCKGVILEDHKNLNDYDLNKNSKIWLTANLIDIMIKTESKESMKISMLSTHKVEHLKTEILKYFKSYSIQDLCLKFNDIYLEDVETLSFYQLSNNCSVKVFLSKRVLVYENATEIFANSEASIKELKSMIENRLGIPAKQQILSTLFPKTTVLSDEDDLDFSCGKLREIVVQRNRNASLRQFYPKESFYALALDKPRGVCLIVSNNKYDDEFKFPRRDTKDIKRLMKTFLTLGYMVIVKINLKQSEVNEATTEILSKFDHSSYDSFVAFFLCHGSNGCIYGIDGEPVYVADISAIFNKCESLNGKPKLIFIQACRNGVDEEGDPDPISQIYVAERDTLVAYSTLPYFPSHRTKSLGSFFIFALCQELDKDEGAQDSILHVLTRVCQSVDQTMKERSKIDQIPQSTVQLSKIFTFS